MNSGGILFRDFWFTYADSTAPVIKGLALSIPLNKCTILVGPTGAGKSTVLKIIRGFHKLYEGKIKGTIRMHGINHAQLSFDDITSLGVVFLHQDPHANVHLLNVRNEIQSGLVYNNVSWQQSIEIVDQIEEYLNISHLDKRCTEQLSEGELQKVGLAASLATSYGVQNSPILLLDSPMSFLDGRSQDDLLEILKKLKKQKMTVLIACSDLDQYEEIADKAVLIEEGRNVREGTAKTLMGSEEYRQTVGTPLTSDIRFLDSIWIKRKPPKNFEETNLRGDYAFIFQNVHFAYDNELFFNNISGQIGRFGTISAIFGHNGSGKTTLLKLMLGVLKPLRGKTYLLGKSPERYSPSEIGLKVAFITQNPTEMFVSNTVEEECLIAPKNLNLDNPEKLVSQALKFTHLDHLVNRSVDSLSSGERRLLSLACTALVTNCNLAVLEEPDFALNPSRWKEVLEILVRFKELGKTVILTTHSMETAIICDEILVLSNGNIIFKGTPSEFLIEKNVIEHMGIRQKERLLKIRKITKTDYNKSPDKEARQ